MRTCSQINTCCSQSQWPGVDPARHTFNPLLQLVNSHLVLAMQLVKQALVTLMHVHLWLIAPTHGGPQLAGEGVLALLKLSQKGWRDGDVVTSACTATYAHSETYTSCF